MQKKRGRPKGSKNKPKTTSSIPKKRGRPKGSKNKPKTESEPKKRGRPKLTRGCTKIFPEYEGVSLVARIKGGNSETHRWVAVDGNERIGFYKTPLEAHHAYQEAQKRK
tara:strand:- start:452 stop:778 length:327 start_codon:yes stop_codon:yes gene_type:complete